MKRTNLIYKVILPTIVLLLLLFSSVFTLNASAFSGPYPSGFENYNFPVGDFAADEMAALAPNTIYLEVVGGDYWPPYIGDLVGASFQLVNNTGQAQIYNEVGVYGTKNGSTQLILTHPGSVTIEAGGSFTYNGQFPGGFGAGTYNLTIYVNGGDGFQTIGGYEYFVVDTAPPDPTAEPTATPAPGDPTPTPTEDNQNNWNGYGRVNNPEKCKETVGSWIQCHLVPPIRGAICWVIQMFNPKAMCKG